MFTITPLSETLVSCFCDVSGTKTHQHHLQVVLDVHVKHITSWVCETSVEVTNVCKLLFVRLHGKWGSWKLTFEASLNTYTDASISDRAP